MAFGQKEQYERFIPQHPISNDYPNKFNFVLIKSLDQLRESLAGLGNLIAIDTETTGLDLDTSFMVGYSYCFNGIDAYYVPVNHATYYEEVFNEISKEEYESICNQQTDIEEYVARKVKNDETFYISMTAEDGMQLFEFQGSTFKRNVGTVIDEGIAEGKFSDVELDFVVSWAKRRGGACNILSKSDFEKWWKRRK